MTALALTSSHAKEVRKAIIASGDMDPLEEYSLPPNTRRAVGTIPGVQRVHFNEIVEATVLEYALNSGLKQDINSIDISQYTDRPVTEIEKVIKSKEYKDTLVLRGIRPGDTTRLNGDQMRALSVMTDLSRNMSLERRLKNAGITWHQWQQWMNNPSFRAHHDRLSEQVFRQAQASVDTQVASGALDGKLDFIKYYNELSGKHDPAKRAHKDIQQILNDIVDIITRNVSDPAVLARISAELSASVAKLG
jgi:hypothetical protein